MGVTILAGCKLGAGDISFGTGTETATVNGVSQTITQVNSTHLSDARYGSVGSALSNIPWYVVGDTGYDTLSTAVTAIGSTQATLIVPAGTHVGGGITTPATLSIVVLKGATITVANATTFTINGPFEAGLYQVFSLTGTGAVSFGTGAVSYVRPNWWYFGSGAWTSALQAAINTGLPVVLQPRSDITSGKLTLLDNTQIWGYGATLSLSASTNDHLLYATNKTGIRIYGLKLNGAKGSNTECSAVYFNICTDPLLADVEVYDGAGFAVSTNGGSVTFYDCIRPKMDRCIVRDSAKEGCYVIGTGTGTGGWAKNCQFYTNEYSGLGTYKHPYFVAESCQLWGNGKVGSTSSQLTFNGLYNKGNDCDAYNGGAGSTSGINVGHDTAGVEGSGTELINCRAWLNPVIGILVGGGATQAQNDVVIKGCLALSNGRDGIKLIGAPRYKLVDSNANGNNVSLGAYANVHIENLSTDGIIDKLSSVNGLGTCYGLWFRAGAVRNKVLFPTFDNNGGTNIVDAGTNNSIYGLYDKFGPTAISIAANGGTKAYTLTIGSTVAIEFIDIDISGTMGGSWTKSISNRYTLSFGLSSNVMYDLSVGQTNFGDVTGANITVAAAAVGADNKVTITLTNAHATNAFAGTIRMDIKSHNSYVTYIQ